MLNPYDLDLGSACDRLRSVTVVRVDTGILSRVVVEFGVTARGHGQDNTSPTG